MNLLNKKREQLNADGELPQIPSTTEYITSKEGKEFKDARSWMQENDHDPFFNVCIQDHLTY